MLARSLRVDEARFSKMAEYWTQIPLLKYSPGRVLYYKKKTLLKSVIHNSRTPLVSYIENSPVNGTFPCKRSKEMVQLVQQTVNVKYVVCYSISTGPPSLISIYIYIYIYIYIPENILWCYVRKRFV